MNNILDCSSISSTFESFERIFNKPKNIIATDLLDRKRLVDKSDYAPDETLYFDFFTLEEQNDIFNKVVFFHLTRTDSPENFGKHGILPTNLIIDQIWACIDKIANENNVKISLSDLRKELENDSESMYYHKIKVDSDGPYAFLTLETAFNSTYNSFLDFPEIIEDILRKIEDKEGTKLYDQYTELTTPYVVRFYAKPCGKMWLYIGAALEYLYWYSVDKKINGLDIGFDGGGKKIPPEQILSIHKIKSNKAN